MDPLIQFGMLWDKATKGERHRIYLFIKEQLGFETVVVKWAIPSEGEITGEEIQQLLQRVEAFFTRIDNKAGRKHTRYPVVFKVLIDHVGERIGVGVFAEYFGETTKSPVKTAQNAISDMNQIFSQMGEPYYIQGVKDAESIGYYLTRIVSPQ